MLQVQQEPQVLKEILELKDCEVIQARGDQQEHKEVQVQLVQRVQQDLVVLTAFRDPRVCQEPQVNQDLREILDLQAHRVRLV